LRKAHLVTLLKLAHLGSVGAISASSELAGDDGGDTDERTADRAGESDCSRVSHRTPER